MKLFLCPVYPRSLYNKLLMRAFDDRIEPVFRDRGGLTEALQCLERGERIIVHVQWEEFFFDTVRTAREAGVLADAVEAQLLRIAQMGAPILWTVHNGEPHIAGHTEQFMRIRRLLARIADRILVHNRASVDFLRGQVPVPDPDKRIILLPHPSYAGLYEPDGTAAAAVDCAPQASGRFVLGFGAMRRQKGLGGMCDALDPAFTHRLGIRLRMAGRGADGQALRQAHAQRDDIDWRLDYVPMEDVPPLFRAARCVVLPYTHLLTSGVALLALTLGAIIVAPALPTFVELLPGLPGRFLYAPGDPKDLRRAVAEAVNLTPQEERACRRAGIALVDPVHPDIISRQLLGIYDILLSDRYGKAVATNMLGLDHADI